MHASSIPTVGKHRRSLVPNGAWRPHRVLVNPEPTGPLRVSRDGHFGNLKPVETMHRAVSVSWLDRADQIHPRKVWKHGTILDVDCCQVILLDKYTHVDLSTNLLKPLAQLTRALDPHSVLILRRTSACCLARGRQYFPSM